LIAFCFMLLFTLHTFSHEEVVTRFSETFVEFQWATELYTWDDMILHNYRWENVKSYNISLNTISRTRFSQDIR
jgi:hypothetical protein